MKPEAPDNHTLVLRRTFQASRLRVFRAWIEPDALERWPRPRGMRMSVQALDARVGGSFQFDFRERQLYYWHLSSYRTP